MPYSSNSRTGCASSVPVSDFFLQGQQQVRAEGEADNNCYSSFGNVVCDRWILRVHKAAHYVAIYGARSS